MGSRYAGFSLVARGARSCGSPALEHRWIVVVTGLGCSSARGILPDQGLNPCFLRWQEDSLGLSHQGSPLCRFLGGCGSGFVQPFITTKVNIFIHLGKCLCRANSRKQNSGQEAFTKQRLCAMHRGFHNELNFLCGHIWSFSEKIKYWVIRHWL